MPAPRSNGLWRAAARQVRARRSVILGYHGVGPAPPGGDPHELVVPPERFRRQIETLLGAGFRFVTVAGMARAAAGARPPAGLIALSFDDGMEDNCAVVLPLLREYGVPATVYVTTGLIGAPNPWLHPSSGARMMTHDELRTLVAAGVEIGAHTVTHPDLSRLGRADCLREMVDSRDELERITGAPVTTFAYPNCRFGPAAVDAAREAGFEAAVTCGRRGGWDPYRLAREMISGREGQPSFMLRLAGMYEPLYASPPVRAVRGTSRPLRRRFRARRGPDG